MRSARSGFSRAGRVALLAAATAGLLPSASITGSVVDNASGRALARSKVTLRARQTKRPAGQLTLYTDPAGGFSFPGLPAGIYFLEAERRGYAKTRYGQPEFESPGTPIVLGADGYFAAEVRLKRFGVITGAVRDENRIGLPGLNVHAYRMDKTWKVVASSRTDDRGVYRLSALKPGRYLVRSAASSIEGGVALLPTYYGDTLSSREARAVEVRLDGEVAAVDIGPAPGLLGNLTGWVTGGAAGEVVLITETGPRMAKVKAGSRFEFGRLEPGDYTLLVAPLSAGGERAAYQEISLGETNLDVTLELKAAPQLSIRCESADAEPVDPRSVSVFLRRPEYGDNSARVLCGDISVWAPGNWQVAVAPPPRYYVAAILEGSSGAEGQGFRITPGDTKQITILLSDDPGLLRGKVTLDEAPVVGAPVFLNAFDNELRNRVGGVRTARADREGEYRFTGLPPGRYEVISSYQIRDPESDGWPTGLGTAVTVEGDEETTQNLSLTSLR